MKNEGIEYFEINNPEVYDMSLKFIEQLNQYGLFVVYKGELESWLTNLNPVSRKKYWLTDIFNKMGNDPQNDAYVKPENDDVWQFMDTIKKWIDNPSRNGM